MTHLKLFNATLISCMVYCLPAYSYLDPGFLSIVFSAILSFIAVTIFYMKSIYYFIKKKIDLFLSFLKKYKDNKK